ncbi:MAG: YveK family protein [Lachnospiraceae bacterium]
MFTWRSAGSGRYNFIIAIITPKYTASTTLYVNNTTGTDATTTITSSDLSASAKLVDTYAAIISSKTVLEQVKDRSEVDIDTGALESMISVSAINGTEVFNVSAETVNPKEAAGIANAIADIAPDQISEIVDGSSVKVVDYADIPTKITLIGVFISFMISVIFILTRELLDTSIKSEADLETWELPILGVMPEFTAAAKMDNYGYQYGKR